MPHAPRPPRAAAAGLAPLLLLVPALTALPLAAAEEPVVYFEDDVEGDLSGWTATGLWTTTTDRANSTATSWYYGLPGEPGPEDNTYDNGTANSGQLLSPPIDLGAATGATLSFWMRWDGEGCDYEHPVVEVVTAEGAVVAWEECMPSPERVVHLDLSAWAGQTVRVRFSWETFDEMYNDHEGWYVDDVRVTSAKTPPGEANLAALDVWFPGVAFDGDTFELRAAVHVHAPRDAWLAFDVEFLVDGVSVGTATLEADAGWHVATSPDWTATTGFHQVTVVVDPAGEVAEFDETDNTLTRTLEVWPERPDLQVDITRVERFMRETPAGRVGDALERHEVDVTLCNVGGSGALTSASLSLWVEGATAGTPRQRIGVVEVEPARLPAGGCHTVEFLWYGAASAGDLAFVALGALTFDPTRENNVDRATTSAHVDGTGQGVAVHVLPL